MLNDKSSLKKTDIPIGLWAVCLFAVLLFALPTMAWLLPETGGAFIAWLGFSNPGLSLPFSQAIKAWAVIMVPVAIVEYGVLSVALFLRRVRRGEGLTLAAAQCISRLGVSLLVASATIPLCRLWLAWFLSDQTSRTGGAAVMPGVLLLAVATSGICLVSLSRVLRRAVAIAEDNARII